MELFRVERKTNCTEWNQFLHTLLLGTSNDPFRYASYNSRVLECVENASMDVEPPCIFLGFFLFRYFATTHVRLLCHFSHKPRSILHIYNGQLFGDSTNFSQNVRIEELVHSYRAVIFALFPAL